MYKLKIKIMTKIDIEFYGIDLEVHYTYQPEERQTHDYPGYPKCAEIDHVFYNGVDLFEIYKSLDKLDELENDILKEYH